MCKKNLPYNEGESISDFFKGNEIKFSCNVQVFDINSILTKKMKKDKKISKALCVNGKQLTCSEFNLIKAALFEIRFADFIREIDLVEGAEYEYKPDSKGSSVDFKIFDKAKNITWLIELTSLRESTAVKEHTRTSGNITEYISASNSGENSPEVRDINKTQSAIFNKVSKKDSKTKKRTPIKFPEITQGTYHMIVVDMRTFNGGGDADIWDYWNIAYGSSSIPNTFCKRTWRDNAGNDHPIKGVFEDNHPESGSKYVRERIHVLGLIQEKKYETGGIREEIKFFYNPYFFKKINEIPKLFNTNKIHLRENCK